MSKNQERIKILNYLEITVNKLKDIDHILVLFASFIFVGFLILWYPNKDVSFGILVGFILTFGIGYFAFHNNYERLEKLYNEEKIRNRDWEKDRDIIFKKYLEGKLEKGKYTSINQN